MTLIVAAVAVTVAGSLWALIPSVVASIPLTSWILRHHFVEFEADRLRISPVWKLSCPRLFELQYSDIRCVRVFPGIGTSHGRPQPRLEFELHDGSTFWFGFGAYSPVQVGEAVAELESRTERGVVVWADGDRL